jgi:hypothetical protein
LLKNLSVKFKYKSYKVDVGINREESSTKDRTQNYFVGKVEDWGDLSIYYGYDEFDLEGYEIKKSKISETSLSKLNELNIGKLIKEGVGFLKLDSVSLKRDFSSLPFNLILASTEIDIEPKYNGFANFTLWKNNKLHYNVINGFIYDVRTDFNEYKNGLIFR